MSEKLKKIPIGVIVVLFVLALVAVGMSAFKTIQKNDVSYTVPMDRQRYMEEMKKRAASGGMGGGYQTSGQPGGAHPAKSSDAQNAMQEHIRQMSGGGGPKPQ